MLETILAKVHQALNRIGQSSDAASPTGSLHAKMANVQNSVNALPTSTQKPRSAYSFKATVAEASTLTVLSLNGVGKLIGFILSGGILSITITIDERTIYSGSITNNYSSYGNQFSMLSFKQSIVITITNSATSAACNVSGTYELE